MILHRIKRKLIRIFFREQWSLLVCDLDGNVLMHILPPKDGIWADPFPIDYNNKTYIFAEEQIGHGNGTLGVIELTKDMCHSPFTHVLKKEYHLSFPNVFPLMDSDQTIWYMVPETHENNTIDLYRSSNFPYDWQLETTLMKNVDASDSIVYYQDPFWYLFTSIGTKEIPKNSNLSLFYSRTFPSTEWIPHPQNPICDDPANSRMAGALFIDRDSNMLCRPSQNCFGDYGKETNINKILELSPLKYSEELLYTIKPESSLKGVGTHTFNHSKYYILRDIKTKNFRKIKEISLKN